MSLTLLGGRPAAAGQSAGERNVEGREMRAKPDRWPLVSRETARTAGDRAWWSQPDRPGRRGAEAEGAPEFPPLPATQCRLQNDQREFQIRARHAPLSMPGEGPKD